MDVRLIIVGGKHAGKEIPVKGARLLIGRAPECQLRPCTTEVSRKHCLITVEGKSARVEDCGSTNGTFLNDERISLPRELKDGDRIKLGPLELEVRVTVGIGGEKRPPVTTVHEAAARTAAGLSGSRLNISSWLAEDSTADASRQQAATSSDTVMGKSLAETVVVPQPPTENKPSKANDEKKSTPTKTAPKSAAWDTGSAADEALRRFFHRKK
jgi:pSer/pThr/pTyr-binding forkhead associated (FHA) protein